MALDLEELKNELTKLNAQKEMAIQQYNQVIGAVAILQQLINKLENPEPKKDDEINNNQEQVA